MNANSEVAKALAVMADTYGKKLSEEAADMFLEDLAGYSPAAVLAALRLCRRELGRFPTVADIITRIQSRDGRPGVEEAWSMIPKTERDSVVWTEEMAAAYGAAAPILRDGDSVGARMAFKEVYDREVRNARDANKPPSWSVSFGEDPNHRLTAVKEAVSRGRLELASAVKICPELEYAGMPTSANVAKLAGSIVKQLEGPAS